MTPPRRIGDYLRELRIVKDMSLREVEKATKNTVSNAYLSQLESGKISNPSPHILKSLAEAYNVVYDELMAAAGYIHSTNKKKSGVAFFNENDISENEKEQLLAYLKFIRNQKKHA
jgi:HTH-type transcriptional regulator, competence development regulator